MIQVFTDSGFNWDNDRLVRVGGAPQSGIPQGAIDRYRKAVQRLAQGGSGGAMQEFTNLAPNCRRESRIEVSAEIGDVADVRAWLTGTQDQRAAIEVSNPFVFDGWMPSV